MDDADRAKEVEQMPIDRAIAAARAATAAAAAIAVVVSPASLVVLRQFDARVLARP